MQDTVKDMRKQGRNLKNNPRSSRRRRLIYCLLLTLFTDQTLKFLILKLLEEGNSIPIVRNVLHLTLVYNTGAVFGFFKGMNFFLLFSSVFLLFLLLCFYPKLENQYPKLHIHAGLISGGALGNMIDRLRFGYVIDFIDFRVWPVFNAADAAITIGTGLVIISLWRKKAD
jgi:signal peptidase II